MLKAPALIGPLASHIRSLKDALGVPGHPTRALAGVSVGLMTSQLAMVTTGIMSARWLGPSGKGLVAAATTWGQLLGWIAGLGVAGAVQVRIAEDHEQDRVVATATALGNALLYSAVVGTSIGALAFVPLSHSLAHLGTGSTPVVALAVLPMPLSVLGASLNRLQLGLGKNRIYSIAAILGPLSTLALVLAAEASRMLSPTVLVLCYLVGGTVALLASARQLPWGSLCIDLRVLWKDTRFGVRLWLPEVMGLANLRLDIVILTMFLSARDIGVYSAANNVMFPLSTFPAAIALVTTSRVARLQARGAQGTAAAGIWGSARQALMIAVAGGLVLAVAAPFIVPLLLGDAYGPAVPIIWLLIAGYVARAVAGVIVSGANGMRKPRAAYVSEGVGLAATMVLLPVLLPWLGVAGAAITSTVSYSASALILVGWLVRVRRAHSQLVQQAPCDPSRAGGIS